MDFITQQVRETMWPVFFFASGGFIGTRVVGIVLWYFGKFYKNESWLMQVENIFRSMLVGIMTLIVLMHFFMS